ncbi:polysaccharide biosynthesis tyrosine autokinase [Ramlibacter sp. MMS24-I3-19]|uniref:polysaccharide biosynthesis tyrosine autokinase n=1 Tax=Ramlibacter sp. MMS24-I3-19 TaxID=3416606 RepID=UPI003D04858D
MPQTTPVPLNSHVARRDEQVVTFRRDRMIGQILSRSRGLAPSDIEGILKRQGRHGGRFGEVAIAMGLVSEEDVLEALAEQFDYPYVRSFGDSALDAELVCACDPLGEEAQSFRELRTELLTGVLDDPVRRAIAVVSPERGDGRSYVASNLAVAFAQLGARTLLVDADLRTPRQHTLFGIGDSLGLSHLLCGRAGPEAIQQPSPVSGLSVIGAGTIPPNPSELLHRGTFAALMQDWLAEFDHVVVDTPAANHGTEARILAATARAALVVGRRNTARMDSLQRLVTSIERGPTALAGVVMNDH